MRCIKLKSAPGGSTALPDQTIRVAIIEDQRELREGLAVLVGEAEGLRCIGAFRSMEEALTGIEREPPDIALVDIGLPVMSGIEGIRLLKKSHPEMLFLVLSVYDDDQRIFEAMCAGACGYLLKKTPFEKVLESLKELMAGGAPMSPEVARRVIELFRQTRPPESAPHRLSPQEMRILKLLGEGHHYKTAAAELNISVNTLSFHMRRIYEKLQVHSKSEAVARALRAGLIH
ncbi:MAG TPA: response regulator transcription factor [Bryobacteraceae bacterium]|jgi:DNA-binding NarL/FixJ family response regulator|nr:response regulator transcription factor [Bryobacteraceae bacterium]